MRDKHDSSHPLADVDMVEHAPHDEVLQPFFGADIDEPIPVQTLDELLLIIPRRVFEGHKFDESTCDGWHLYGVE